MPRQKIICGLDLGSSKVVALIAEVASNFENEMRVLGVGESSSTGFRKGVMVDLEQSARAIREAVAHAEQMAGTGLEQAYISITGSHLTTSRHKGVVTVTGANREIGVGDIRRVIDSARTVPVPGDRQIVHVLPREYTVDGYNGIIDPEGMTGSRLEVEAQLVTAPTMLVQNLLRAVNRAGVAVRELVLGPLAASEAVLLPAERDLGTALVDIGAGTTEVAVFDNGGLSHLAVLPLGGEYITRDLAMGLKTTPQFAEKIKKEDGSVLVDMMSDQEMIKVPSVGGTGEHLASKRFIASIIEPRIEEILSLVYREIKGAGSGGLLPGGVVLTGGVAATEGLDVLAAELLRMPVRVGTLTSGLGGMADLLRHPAYAAAAGLVIYGARQSAAWEAAAGSEDGAGYWLDRIKAWFRDFWD